MVWLAVARVVLVSVDMAATKELAVLDRRAMVDDELRAHSARRLANAPCTCPTVVPVAVAADACVDIAKAWVPTIVLTPAMAADVSAPVERAAATSARMVARSATSVSMRPPTVNMAESDASYTT